MSPWVEQAYRQATHAAGQGFLMPPVSAKTHAYCEGCRTYIPLANKVGITKGWRCRPCKKKAQGCCGGGT